MADISKIKIGDTEYDVKDATARFQLGYTNSKTVTVRGDNVFGVVFRARFDMGTFIIMDGTVAFDECMDGIAMGAGTGYISFGDSSHSVYYAVFGADSITED